jgi:uncharacterized membrane protein
MVGRDALREYVRGSLWVLPGLSVLVALAVGAALSSVRVGARSPLAFQGTPTTPDAAARDHRHDDHSHRAAARPGRGGAAAFLHPILAAAAAQLLAGPAEPGRAQRVRGDLRLQRGRAVHGRRLRRQPHRRLPRLAVSGAIVLLFASLGLLVFFADHLLHSIQVDAIMETVQRNTLAVIRDGLLTGGHDAPEVPEWAVAVVSQRSGYVQAVRPGMLLPHAVRHGVSLRLRPRVGEHVVAGTTLVWIWRASPRDPAPDPQVFSRVLGTGVRIGFERTLEHDAAFGIRQLVDVACKALSPAVNDPYTAVQAVDHLSVIFCALAQRPLGNHVARDGGAAVIVPGRRFPEYLAVMCGPIRRYGAREPTVAHALLQLLSNCAAVAGDDPERCAAIEEQARIVIADAEREVAQPIDLAFAHAEAEAVRLVVAGHRAASHSPAGRPDEPRTPSPPR